MLALHWFNPLVWLAFALMTRDMEMSCDEAVIRRLGSGIKKGYSASLLNMAAGKNLSGGVPLAFGEGNVKERIRNVLRYRKTGILILILCVLGVLYVVGALATDPKTGQDNQMQETGADGIRGADDAERDIPGADSIRGADDAERDIPGADGADRNGADTDGAGSVPGTPPADGNGGAASADSRETERFLNDWAQAFCARDGEAIRDMASAALLEELGLTQGDSFGVSSPWPWNGDYKIEDMGVNSATILYYALTSDPHVTVWRETLEYEYAAQTGKLSVTSEQLQVMQYIVTGEEYEQAYPMGRINGTPMDYKTNGLGEALNQNALQNPYSAYAKELLEPQTAAIVLLNLLKNENKIQMSYGYLEDGTDDMFVTIAFMESQDSVTVVMTQPYGSDGIWVPQSMEKR